MNRTFTEALLGVLFIYNLGRTWPRLPFNMTLRSMLTYSFQHSLPSPRHKCHGGKTATRPQAHTYSFLPITLRTLLTPDELELATMEQLINIVPLFRSGRIRLISVSPGFIGTRLILHACHLRNREHIVFSDHLLKRGCRCGSRQT